MNVFPVTENRFTTVDFGLKMFFPENSNNIYKNLFTSSIDGDINAAPSK